MQRFFFEGRLFSHTFYGFALVNMATAAPGDAAAREHALAELERLLPIAEAQIEQPPFLGNKHLTPRGGVILAGQANLLRAGYALLGGTREEIIAAFHQGSAVLHAAFMRSPNASLESYPQMFWPVDNCCALESLRLHDVLYGTDYAEACRRWVAWMDEHRDPETGMMVALVSGDGTALQGPRGCALSWSLAFLPGFAPELAREQYGRYRSGWFVHVLGITGAREWPPGTAGYVDADTGPIVGGIGAAAKANGDAANLTGMLRGVELFGLPLWSPTSKDYFLGSVLLADELALWGKTVRVWDRPPSEDRPQPWPAQRLGAWWFAVLLAVLPTGAVLFLTGRWAARALASARRDPDRWSGHRRLVFAIEALAVGAWLAFPAVTWFHAVLLIGVVSTVERRLLGRGRRKQ